MGLTYGMGVKHDLHGSEWALCLCPALRPSESEMHWVFVVAIWWRSVLWGSWTHIAPLTSPRPHFPSSET